MTTGFWILLVICFIQCVALTVVIFVFLESDFAWALVFFLLFTLYAFAQYVMRIKYSNRPLKISDKVKVSSYTQ